jgi:DNA-binding transcriptional LysR family regulator
VNIAAIDLNLLVVFEALYAELSVTAAARRLGLSQPATSNALARLRRTLGDPLFVRVGRRLQATPRADALARRVQRGLGELREALAADQSFEPARSSDTFTIATADYFEMFVVPVLCQRLADVAPAVTLRVVRLTTEEPPAGLRTGEIDLAISVFRDVPRGYNYEPILSDTFVCLLHQRLAGTRTRLSRSWFVRLPHVLVSPGGGVRGQVDEALARYGLARFIRATVSSFATAPLIAAQADVIVTAPTRVAGLLARPMGLQVFPPPVHVPGFLVTQCWHQRVDRDPASLWLRRMVAEAAASV